MARPFTPTIRGYTRATGLEDTDAFEIDRVGTGTMYIEAQDMGFGPSVGGFYVATGEALGDPLTASEFIWLHPFTVAVDFEANFAGSKGVIHPDNLPTATTVLVVQKVSAGSVSNIGTMSISTSGVYSFSGAAVSFAIGTAIGLAGPASPDATAANMSWTFLGALSA